MELYRHSGTMPLVGIPVVVLFGAGTAAVLGFAYSYATVYCPIVYVNFLLTGLLGLGIGWAVAKGARIGNIRNNYVSGAYGLAFGLVGLYVAWVADMAARLGAMGGPAAGDFSQLVVAAFSPSVLWEYIQVFYDKGFWCISHHGQGGDTVKGVFLAIVWVLEGGAILACAAGCAYRMSAALPFCETCNRWTVLEKAVRRLLPLGLKADSVDRAVAGNVDGLTDLARADGDPATCLELDLACCPNWSSRVPVVCFVPLG